MYPLQKVIWVMCDFLMVPISLLLGPDKNWWDWVAYEAAEVAFNSATTPIIGSPVSVSSKRLCPPLSSQIHSNEEAECMQLRFLGSGVDLIIQLREKEKQRWHEAYCAAAHHR